MSTPTVPLRAGRRGHTAQQRGLSFWTAVTYPLSRKAQPGLQEDFDALSPDVRVKAMEVFVDVADGLITGQPLEDRPSTGDLSDCFKVYFDTDRDRKPRYRLVYRLLSNGTAQFVAAEFVAVGRRAALDAYVRAARRLGRLGPSDDS